MTTTTSAPPVLGSLDIDEFGIQIKFLATGESTAGAYTALRYRLPGRRAGAPPHYHKKTTESFYVLEGRLTMLRGGQWVTVDPGTMVTILPGEVHGFRNDYEDAVTFLGFASPAGIEKFLTGLVELVRAAGEWPPKDPSLLAKYGQWHDNFYL